MPANIGIDIWEDDMHGIILRKNLMQKYQANNEWLAGNDDLKRVHKYLTFAGYTKHFNS